MNRKNVPQTVPEVLEHFRLLEQEPLLVQQVRDEIPTHFFVPDKEARYYAWCSHCGEWVMLDKSRHRDRTVCPVCNEVGDIIHEWRGFKHLTDKVLMYIYSKSVKSPQDTITARAIYMEIRWFEPGADGHSYMEPSQVKPYVVDDSYYVFVHGHGAVQARPVCNRKADPDYPSNTSKQVISKSINHRFGAYMGNGRCNVSFYVSNESIDEAAAGTPFRYVWDELAGSFTDRGNNGAYIRLFTYTARHPFAVEVLAKMGSPTRDWLYSITENGHTAGGILNWQGKTLQKLFRYNLCKQEKQWLRSAGALYWPPANMFRAWQWLRKQGNTQITLPDIVKYQLNEDGMRKAMEVIDLYRLVKYLARQQEKRRKHNITLDLYVDYLRDCQVLGLDTTKKSNFMPADLIKSHNALTEEARAMRELQREEEERRRAGKRKRAANAKNQLYRKFRAKILRQYAFEADGMMIYVPKKLEELIDEGIAMHTCVGTYVDRVAKGETIVVFIRSQENHNERIGTMEISKDGTCIIQARAKYNRNLSPEADEFVRKFKEAKIDKFTGRKSA